MIAVSEWLLAEQLGLVVEEMVCAVRPIIADVGQRLMMVDGGGGGVCVCVCVCVFILFHREGFFRLQDVGDILEGYGSTMLCYEYHSRCFYQVPSSRYLKMPYFTSKDETPARRQTGEK